jgi:hypothetical protein
MDGMDARLQRWFMPWRWNRWAWAMCLLLVPPFYVASAGPVFGLYIQRMLPDPVERAAIFIYAPLHRMDITFGPFDSALGRYEAWWADRIEDCLNHRSNSDGSSLP